MVFVESAFEHAFLHARSNDGRCIYSWHKDEGLITQQLIICGQEAVHEWHIKFDPLGLQLKEEPSCPSAKQQLDKVEAVDHPLHYGGGDDPFEHVKVAEAKGWGYHIGNCTKYLWRMGLKVGANDLEDLKKARWYLDRFIQLLEQRNRGNEPGMDGFHRVRLGELLPHHPKCLDKNSEHAICAWVTQ